MKNYDMFQSVYSGWGNCATNHLHAGAICEDRK